jgi:hypothetical protein
VDRVWETNPNMLIPYYLMFSYINLIEDTEFDQLCKTLLEKLDGLTHMHKHLVKKESLTAGTGYDIVYTNMIKGSAMLLLEKWNK